MRTTLEVCVDNAFGLRACIDGGADRVELCSALALGGLTPSVGLMHEAAKCPIPVYAIVRPREGDFQYDAAEISIMLRDIDMARQIGLAGVAFGAALGDGSLDRRALGRLKMASDGLGTTLHRVFDCAPDKEAAMNVAADLGFERILTSGGAIQAKDGISCLAQLHRKSAGRIEIMAGSGIQLDNIAKIAEATGIRSFHASCAIRTKADASLVDFGFAATTTNRTDASTIAALVRELRTIRR